MPVNHSSLRSTSSKGSSPFKRRHPRSLMHVPLSGDLNWTEDMFWTLNNCSNNNNSTIKTKPTPIPTTPNKSVYSPSSPHKINSSFRRRHPYYQVIGFRGKKFYLPSFACVNMCVYVLLSWDWVLCILLSFNVIDFKKTCEESNSSIKRMLIIYFLAVVFLYIWCVTNLRSCHTAWAQRNKNEKYSQNDAAIMINKRKLNFGNIVRKERVERCGWSDAGIQDQRENRERIHLLHC